MIGVTIAAVALMRPTREPDNSESSPSSFTGSSSAATPTTELPVEFWGNIVDLSARQTPLDASGKMKKWPAEPGFTSTPYSLATFQAQAESDRPLAGAVVFLDPGHGGEDLGAVFPRAPIAPAIIESRINMSIAFLLRDLLEAAGATVVLTREDDTFYRLYYRSAIVGKFILQDFLDRLNNDSPNRNIITGYLSEMDKTLTVNNNDDPTGIFYPQGVSQDVKNILDIEDAYHHCIYLSLHCNASETPDTLHGARVFYVSNDSVYRMQSLQTKDIVFPEYQNYNDDARLRLSNLLYDNITGQLPTMVFSQKSGAVEETDYAVIREMNLVGALIEMGFVNHEGDRAVLQEEQNQKAYAQAIYDAVYAYFCR
jgi:N-acetylmuramoyl-L-alanine amidase